MKRIAVLGHVTEAQLLAAMLDGQGIPHVIRSYHDSAYDGLFQASMGWGHVEADQEHEADILALLESLRTREGIGPAGEGPDLEADGEDRAAIGGFRCRLPEVTPGSRLLFHGDSITDMQWGRDQRDRNHYLGHAVEKDAPWAEAVPAMRHLTLD